MRHIEKHGTEHVETLWYCLFLDKESCTEFALKFSDQQNIVESEDWLNLKPENGLDGGTRKGHMKGIPKPEEFKLKLKGLRNRCDTWKITTPSNEVVIVQNLGKYCRDNSLSYQTFTNHSKSGKPIPGGKMKGYSIMKLEC